MKRKWVLSFCLLISFVMVLSSCSNTKQPEYDIENFESFVYSDIVIDDTKTISSLKSDGVVSFSVEMANEQETTRRIFLLSPVYRDFLLYISELTNDHKDELYSYFKDISKINIISVSYQENVLYFSTNKDKEATFAIVLSSTASVQTDEEKTKMNHYIEAFAGQDLTDIFLPYLINHENIQFSDLANRLASMDNFNVSQSFYYIDVSPNGIIGSGGGDSTIEKQGSIGLWIDENSTINTANDFTQDLHVIAFIEDDE